MLTANNFQANSDYTVIHLMLHMITVLFSNTQYIKYFPYFTRDIFYTALEIWTGTKTRNSVYCKLPAIVDLTASKGWNKWTSKASPTLGCSIEILQCEGRLTWPKRAHAQSQYWAVKTDP